MTAADTLQKRQAGGLVRRTSSAKRRRSTSSTDIGLVGLRRRRRSPRRAYRRNIGLYRLHADEPDARLRRHRLCQSGRGAASSVCDRALRDARIAGRRAAGEPIPAAPPPAPDPARVARAADYAGTYTGATARRCGSPRMAIALSADGRRARRSRSTRAAATSSGPTIRSTRRF